MKCWPVSCHIPKASHIWFRTNTEYTVLCGIHLFYTEIHTHSTSPIAWHWFVWSARVLVENHAKENQLSEKRKRKIVYLLTAALLLGAFVCIALLHRGCVRWRKIIYKSAKQSSVCNICYCTVERDANSTSKLSETNGMDFSPIDDYYANLSSFWTKEFRFYLNLIVSVKIVNGDFVRKCMKIRFFFMDFDFIHNWIIE